MKRVKFVGLDVHAETIAVAVAERFKSSPEDSVPTLRVFVIPQFNQFRMP
jgi:hypothetical protein